MTDANKIADQIQKTNCFCNCKAVALICTVKRDRIKEAIFAAELRGKIAGMREAAVRCSTSYGGDCCHETAENNATAILVIADRLEREAMEKS
jgi:hypothetical protein